MIGQDNDLTHVHQQATDRLQRELGDQLPGSTIEQAVRAALDELSDARITTFVPVFTYRLARERLMLMLPDRN